MIRSRIPAVKVAAIRLFQYIGHAARSHPVLCVVSLATIGRLAVALVVRFRADGTLFPDDAGYLTLASQLSSGDTESWNEHELLLVRYTALFLQPLAWLLHIIHDPLVGQLMVMAWGVAATVLVALMGHRIAGAPGAWVAGGAIGLIPSHVLWSSIVLKDAVVWALLAGLCMAGSRLQSAPRWQAATTPLGVIAILMTGLAFSRPHVAIISAFALVIVAPFGEANGRIQRAAMSVLVAILIPWLVGFGPLGIGFLQESMGHIDSRRLAAAQSDTGFIPLVDDGAAEMVDDGAAEMVDDGAAEMVDDGAAESRITTINRGISVVLLEPGPWRFFSGHHLLMLAAAEVLLLWYPVLVLAVIGLVRLARRRDPHFMYAVVLAAGIVLAQALVQGNLGTAYRHRAELAVIVAVLAAVGLGAGQRPTSSIWRWGPCRGSRGDAMKGVK